jgi:hypothetical protein
MILVLKVKKKQHYVEIPVTNDIVIYSSNDDDAEIIKSRPKFSFKTERQKLLSIALVGTFPQGYDFVIDGYYDILMSNKDGLNILRWFSSVWEHITGEKYEF